MLKIYKISLLVFLTMGLTQNGYAFDLKSLTDKIQKDIGGKLNVPNNSASNPLGGMLKGLNQNTGDVSTNTVGGNTTNTNGNSKLAKGICEPNIPQTIKNLPQGKITQVENDFDKKENEIIKIINTIPQSSNDPYVSSLKAFEGAFETKEIEILFNNFIKKRNIKDLATIRAISAMQAGFNNNKKQIKADALFAYGLIHYYLRDVGGNKNLGINYIKQAMSGPDNIGALTVYGAWQFFGINVKQNTQAGNMGALTGYQRAGDKKLKLNQNGPFKGLKEFKWAEKVFFIIADDNKNPYKAQYQSQLARAAQMNKSVMAELSKSEKNDPKSGWWPFVVSQQNRQHAILDELGQNLGLGNQLSELKAQYAVLASKVSSDNKLVERMVIINEEMNLRVQKALNSSKAVDEKGKIQIANLAHDNEVLILKNNSFVLSLMANMLAGGGFGGAGFSELTKITAVAGGNEKIACEVYSGVKSYASRTNITMPKPVTTENTKFKSKFRKKTKS
mgnify:FL=1|jgi:hypothetical protein|tara:strand:- start:4650 stop:6161 length:1512 start_codon:yes stop_codon:yes gene_type:complete